MDDYRRVVFGAKRKVRGKAGPLTVPHLRVGAAEIVEAGFPYPNNPGMAQRIRDPIGFDKGANTFRMNAGSRPDVVMTFGNREDIRVRIAIYADTEKAQNARSTSCDEFCVAIIEEIQMAMGIDQHAYIVCVWRSDCSAPARYVSILERATSSWSLN